MASTPTPPSPPLDPDAGEGGDLAALRMAHASDVFEAVVAHRRRGAPCVLCTVITTSGQAPRKQAARLLVGAEGPVSGSVGGGRLEKEVVAAALTLLGERDGARARLDRFRARDAEDGCGGETEVFLEPLVPGPLLVVFGAGHVARALVPLARAVGFRPVVVDQDPSPAASDAGAAASPPGPSPFATAERFPDAAAIVAGPDGWDEARWGALPLDDRAFAVIVTRDHAADLRLLEALLGRDLAYLGMIGARRKVDQFRARLEARGVAPARLARLHAPIGLPIGAETPEEIAVSIVSQLISVRSSLRLL